ncbi:MAG: hypothetical protein H7641_08935 [Candidatus Heimdallarchaeota archaeon]|nr:hypothetical protein [Candidatus Heimdallarchaeota archaeon]MCK4877691.1 hypothetical protein [Candidatus Heimdallarchaeota archaeon]
MVKALVLYNSRGGNTKQVAMKIAEGLGTECRNNKKIPDLKEYDLIIVGSWVIMGRISFAGARYLRKLKRKGIEGRKVALFFTSGAPDDIHPMTERKGTPKKIKEVMFETMERILTKKNKINILSERFYCKGAIRITKHGEVKDNVGHPTEEELAQAKAFGEQLKNQFETSG